MPEQQNHTPQAAEESALTDESLESVAGGVNTFWDGVIEPPVSPPPTTVEPVLIDGTTL